MRTGFARFEDGEPREITWMTVGIRWHGR